MSWKRDKKITNLRTLHTERPTPVLLLSSGGQLLGPTPGFNNLTSTKQIINILHVYTSTVQQLFRGNSVFVHGTNLFFVYITLDIGILQQPL